MQEISNHSIAVLVLGTILMSVFIFLVLMGNQSNLEKVMTNMLWFFQINKVKSVESIHLRFYFSFLRVCNFEILTLYTHFWDFGPPQTWLVRRILAMICLETVLALRYSDRNMLIHYFRGWRSVLWVHFTCSFW